MERDGETKTILIHVGPHHTGASAIQRSLADLSRSLRWRGVHVLPPGEIEEVAAHLAKDRFKLARAALTKRAGPITALRQKTVIISHEDLCGTPPGRSDEPAIYPRLARKLRLMADVLAPHDVRFVFFEPDQDDWLGRCYRDHLHEGTAFHRMADFRAHFGPDWSWARVLQRTRKALGARFVVLDHDPAPQAAVTQVLNLLPDPLGGRIKVPAVADTGQAPTEAQVAALERINEMSEFEATAWFAKSLVGRGAPDAPPSQEPSRPAWPPQRSTGAPVALPALLERATRRVRRQRARDLLPPVTVDLRLLADERLPRDVSRPEVKRARIQDQLALLRYQLRGKSGLSLLNALTISYLRRDTRHTEKARTLFHRIWREQGHLLINELSTRWLISTLQTFLDHGETEAQRMIGAAGYFYGNMMKIYEGERALEGLAQGAPYPHLTPQSTNRFRGLDRYPVGGTDLLLNTNALALDIASRDPAAGLVLQEFLLRVKSSKNVFWRHDRTRKAHDVNIPPFHNVWSFYEPWED